MSSIAHKSGSTSGAFFFHHTHTAAFGSSSACSFCKSSASSSSIHFISLTSQSSYFSFSASASSPSTCILSLSTYLLSRVLSLMTSPFSLSGRGLNPSPNCFSFSLKTFHVFASRCSHFSLFYTHSSIRCGGISFRLHSRRYRFRCQTRKAAV